MTKVIESLHGIGLDKYKITGTHSLEYTPHALQRLQERKLKKLRAIPVTETRPCLNIRHFFF